MIVCPRCRAVYATDREACTLDGSPLVDRDSDPFVGTELNQYRILGRVGGGAMGTVYRAQHAVLGRTHAIKVLCGDLAGDRRGVARFRQEATAIAQIDHPNVVTINDFATTSEGLPFIVMELIDGEPLDRVIRAEGPFDAPRARRIARQIASGLDAAHSQGTVHRDLKPGNIILTSSPDGERVKLVDFGIAAVARQNPNATRLTQVGVTLGTPRFMAPEQFGDSTVGPAADLYSLGVVLYTMLDGRAPFNGAPLKLRELHLSATPPPLPDCDGLAPLVARLLAKIPSQRPASARAVADELDAAPRPAVVVPAIEAADGPAPNHAPPPSPPAARRATWPLWGALGLLVLIGAAVGWTLSEPVGRVTAVRGSERTGGGDPPPPAARAAPRAAVSNAQPGLRTDDAGPEVDEPTRARNVDGPGAAAPSDAGTTMAERIASDPQPGLQPEQPARTGAAKPQPRLRRRVTGERPRRPIAKPPAPAPSEPRPDALERGTTGALYVVTRVGALPRPAEVFVDGTRRGETPVRLDVGVGTHTIELRLPGGLRIVREVIVESEAPTRLVLDLSAEDI